MKYILHLIIFQMQGTLLILAWKLATRDRELFFGKIQSDLVGIRGNKYD